MAGTLWNLEEGLGSCISLLGWLRAQWSRRVRVQELEAEGIEEAFPSPPAPLLGLSEVSGKLEDSHSL